MKVKVSDDEEILVMQIPPVCKYRLGSLLCVYCGKPSGTQLKPCAGQEPVDLCRYLSDEARERIGCGS